MDTGTATMTGTERRGDRGRRRRRRRRSGFPLPLALSFLVRSAKGLPVRAMRRSTPELSDVDVEKKESETVSAYTSAEKGKGRELAEEEPKQRRQFSAVRTTERSLLRFNAQKSPFHSSAVGSLASRQPAAVSVGIFPPGYPFRPSGRRKVREEDIQSSRRTRGARSPDDYSDLRAEKVAYESLFNVPQDVFEDDILKHGWTRAMLDDDARLAVPDDARRPRGDTAVMQAKKLLGKSLYRWQPGQGYVLSRYKDYSSYKKGPGIALGQLLPPREHAYTSSLPFIPNDSKRDLAWMVVGWIAILACLAIFMEARSMLRKTRKGKRKEIVDGSNDGVPSIRLFTDGAALDEAAADEDEAVSPVHTSSFQQFYLGTNTRQRTQARNFRELCKAALFSNTASDPSASSVMTGAMKWNVLGSSADGNGALSNGRAGYHHHLKEGPSYVLQDVAWPKKEEARNANGSADVGARRTRNVDPKDMTAGGVLTVSRDDILLSPPTKNRPPARRAVTQAYPLAHGNRALSGGRSIIQSASNLFVGGGGGGGKAGPPIRRDS